jgi:hypothetical protein
MPAEQQPPTIKCVQCGHKVYVEPTPEFDNDNAWHRLATIHRPTCPYVQTRGKAPLSKEPDE